MVDDVATLLDATMYNSTGYILVTLGIVVSIRFMGFPDLTVDGSFTLGAAIYAVGIKSGFPVVVCLAMAGCAGLVAGTMTATVNRGLQIGQILSGILVMLFLITAVPYLTGGATVGLLSQDHWIARLQQWDLRLTRAVFPDSNFSLHLAFIGVLAVVGGVAVFLVRLAFRTRIGAQMRYLGSAKSPNLLSGNQRTFLMYAGLAFGNALVAAGGAVEAERHGGFNQNMGIGVLLIGLASLILGESILKTRLRRDWLHVSEYLVAAVVGVLVYSFVLQFLLLIGLTFLDVRLTTTVFLLLLLAFAARCHPNSARLF